MQKQEESKDILLDESKFFQGVIQKLRWQADVAKRLLQLCQLGVGMYLSSKKGQNLVNESFEWP